MALKPTITQNQVRTTTITGTPKFPPQLKCELTERHNDRKKRIWTPDEKASALVAQLRLICCQRILDKMDDKTSPEGGVFAAIIMEAKATLHLISSSLSIPN